MHTPNTFCMELLVFIECCNSLSFHFIVITILDWHLPQNTVEIATINRSNKICGAHFCGKIACYTICCITYYSETECNSREESGILQSFIQILAIFRFDIYCQSHSHSYLLFIVNNLPHFKLHCSHAQYILGEGIKIVLFSNGNWNVV